MAARLPYMRAWWRSFTQDALHDVVDQAYLDDPRLYWYSSVGDDAGYGRQSVATLLDVVATFVLWCSVIWPVFLLIRAIKREVTA